MYRKEQKKNQISRTEKIHIAIIYNWEILPILLGFKTPTIMHPRSENYKITISKITFVE